MAKQSPKQQHRNDQTLHNLVVNKETRGLSEGTDELTVESLPSSSSASCSTRSLTCFPTTPTTLLVDMNQPPPRSILKTPETTNETSCSSKSAASSRRRREVTFDTIIVRKYPMAIGDHPACTIGAPVSLAWEYDQEEAVDLDVYECERGRRRQLRHLVLSYYRRQDILRNAGYSDEEIKQAAKKVSKTQRQRGRTRFFNPVAKLEDIACSAGRKMKRLVVSSNGSKQSAC